MPEKVLNSNVEPEEDGLVNGGPRPQDLVKVSGKPENCEQAKEALLAAIPITVEVSKIIIIYKLLENQYIN